jgi:hypothetical protein
MVPLTALWLPVLLAGVLVFVASSIIHMVLGYHASDWRRPPSEDALLDALRPLNLPPGDYGAPRPDSMAQMSTPEFKAKLARGPRVLLRVMGPVRSMGQNLVLWFIYSIVVAVFAGYLAGATLAPGVPYLVVFRVTGTVAFAAYALALWQHWIWYSQSTSYTLKATGDSLLYALLTAGVFGWLWPQA